MEYEYGYTLMVSCPNCGSMCGYDCELYQREDMVGHYEEGIWETRIAAIGAMTSVKNKAIRLGFNVDYYGVFSLPVGQWAEEEAEMNDAFAEA